MDEYPLPRIEEIYANLSGGQQFNVIDLRQAYLQMEVEEESKTYLTVNTHRGLYQYQRLPYGVASAMDQVLQGIPGVQCYLDDIIITGRTREEHLKALDKVLGRPTERNANFCRTQLSTWAMSSLPRDYTSHQRKCQLWQACLVLRTLDS